MRNSTTGIILVIMLNIYLFPRKATYPNKLDTDPSFGILVKGISKIRKPHPVTEPHAPQSNYWFKKTTYYVVKTLESIYEYITN